MPPINTFQSRPFQQRSDPVDHCAVVTPSDSVDFDQLSFISIGGSGTLSLVFPDGEVVTFADGELAQGGIHPFRVRRVNATGTTAAPIKRWW